MLGLLADLLLIGHDEDALQVIPLVALGLGTMAIFATMASQALVVVVIGRIVLVGVAACGALGMWLHYRANAAFQLEMDPSLAAFDLFWSTLRTKAPPAIAPGQMALLSLMALIALPSSHHAKKGLPS